MASSDDVAAGGVMASFGEAAVDGAALDGESKHGDDVDGATPLEGVEDDCSCKPNKSKL